MEKKIGDDSMLEIKECLSPEKYENLISEKNFKAVEAYDKEKIIGYALYGLDDEYVYLYHCEYNNDLYLCDGILRAILFKSLLKGIDKAKYLSKKQEDNLFAKLNYINNNQNEINSINNFLNKCEKCKETK
ncbi:MAG: hypothetical protein KBG30_09415 [Bacteroidales bacterium]|nr:hypothetical protein [Bacteroidales bacterium]